MQVLQTAVVAIDSHNVSYTSQGVHVVTATQKKNKEKKIVIIFFCHQDAQYVCAVDSSSRKKVSDSLCCKAAHTSITNARN